MMARAAVSWLSSGLGLTLSRHHCGMLPRMKLLVVEDEAAIEEFAAPALESEANVDPAGVTGQNGPAGGSAKPEAASP